MRCEWGGAEGRRPTASSPRAARRLPTVGSQLPVLEWSIINKRPYDRGVAYPLLDLLISIVLAVSFIIVYRFTLKIEQQVDEGQATPEDYTVLIAEPPPLLGCSKA